MDNLAIYIHIPFCARKCGYCDFYSLPVSEMEGESFSRVRRDFISSLVTEIGMYGDRLGQRRVTSVFFGGGTPSLLKAGEIGLIMDIVRERFILSEDAEITMEANPDTVSIESLSGYRAAGVNRISFGVQSFSDSILERIGRVHDGAGAVDAFRMAREAGFGNISIDLIIGLPDQTWEDVGRDLDIVEGLRPDHVSVYGLKVEEGTPFWEEDERGMLKRPGEDDESDMFDLVVERLSSMGIERYEVSNFARKGFRSAHNMTYWSHGEYIGLGPSAHGFIDMVRYSNLRSLGGYVDMLSGGCLPVEDMEAISEEDARFEALMLGLRITDGIRISEYEKRYGFSFDEMYGERAGRLIESGLAEIGEKPERVFRLTRKGFEIQNYCLRELL